MPGLDDPQRDARYARGDHAFTEPAGYPAFETDGRTRDTGLAEGAAQAGVQLAPNSRYCIEAKRNGWLFGYEGYSESALGSAARALGRQIG